MKYLSILLLFFICSSTFAQLSPKEKAVQDFREYFSKHAYRGHQLGKSKTEKITSERSLELLGDDGRFTDLIELQDEVVNSKMHLANYSKSQSYTGSFLEIAFNRIWRIAQTYRGKNYSEYKDDKTLIKLYKAINNYSEIEIARGSIQAGRFHVSCFALPTASVNTYFCLFGAMEHVEKDSKADEIAKEANKNLLHISFQSWTQPFRGDDTDKNVVSVERFQKHVWWVGGNGLGFRSLLPTAAAMHSVEMMDVLAIVSKGGLSPVSQNTYDDAFWTEGFTADGAGWGHGMQCLIWGYPISGASAALEIVNYFQGTPWAKQLDKVNADALLNYFRGSAWYYYKGYIPRSLGRMSMVYYDGKEESIKTNKMIKNTLKDWRLSYPLEEQKELLDLQQDLKDNHITMDGYKDGYYNGTRWFFNNDNLVKKNPNYYILVSMASIRCDGIESAHDVADRYNFFTCDGMTHFMKDGDEYHKAQGAWNLTAIPGVTSRQGEENLVPVTNWRGYCSKHNFAAAATSGGKNAASGFIFEKMNGSDKKDVNDTTGRSDLNKSIYGVKAYKGYFMVDDYMVTLGAGITNLTPEMEGDIWTTIDQTHYNGGAQYFSNGKITKSNGDKTVKLEDKDVVWGSQKDGFSYAVLPEFTTGQVYLSTETRDTKWEEINVVNRKKKNLPKTEDIFQIYINHGKDVKNGSYAYVVYGGDQKPKKAFSDMPLDILENSTDIQAIAWGKDYVGASFYNPKKVLTVNKEQISVSAPCALLMEKDGNGYKLSITDAEMNEDLKTIIVKTTLKVSGDNVSKDGKWSVISIAMPQGNLCGKPATVLLGVE